MNRPLEGLLVVSIDQAVAAPYAASRLADAGARVIKVERPGGDFARGYDTFAGGESAYFVWLNRGKESIELDFKQAEDMALLKNMIAQADIFIQNLAPGAAERAGGSLQPDGRSRAAVDVAAPPGFAVPDGNGEQERQAHRQDGGIATPERVIRGVEDNAVLHTLGRRSVGLLGGQVQSIGKARHAVVRGQCPTIGTRRGGGRGKKRLGSKII